MSGASNLAHALMLATISLQGIRWRFQANDNTRGGWLVFSVYVIVTALCWRATTKRYSSASDADVLKPKFWLALSLLVTAVGINKQLDLHALFNQLGRVILISAGISEYVRLFRTAIVVAVAIPVALTLTCLWKLAWRASPSERLVVVGTSGLVGFVLLRTASIELFQVLERHRPVLALELVIVSFLSFAVWRHGRFLRK